MLDLKDVHAGYGGAEVLKGISIELAEAEGVTVIGANGAGKTTILKVICGLLRPKKGTVEFLGDDLSRLSPHFVVERGIVMVPERRRLFTNMTVLENLEMGGYRNRRKKELSRKILGEIFSIFPRLAERRSQRTATLSGGEQQMLAIGRALMAKPRLLLLDEPSLGLAPVLVAEIFRIIKDIHATGMTILIVEQQTNYALEIASRGYVIQTGEIVLADTSENLRANEMVRNAYLGG